jgi:hypothetical protein
LIAPVLQAHSSTAQTPTSQTLHDESPTLQKAKKVWTNDDLGHSKDVAATAGAGATGRPSPRSFSSSGISIVSPAAQTAVAPGETFSVEVSVDSGSDVGQMAIIGPMGFGTTIREAPPYSFRTRSRVMASECPTPDGRGADLRYELIAVFNIWTGRQQRR